MRLAELVCSVAFFTIFEFWKREWGKNGNSRNSQSGDWFVLSKWCRILYKNQNLSCVSEMALLVFSPVWDKVSLGGLLGHQRHFCVVLEPCAFLFLRPIMTEFLLVRFFCVLLPCIFVGHLFVKIFVDFLSKCQGCTLGSNFGPAVKWFLCRMCPTAQKCHFDRGFVP